ncbi:MAG: hypothetical protein AAF466_11125 [Bacteroidota bacterium]
MIRQGLWFALLLLVVSCGAPIKHSGNTIENDTSVGVVKEDEPINNNTQPMPAIPEGAVTGLFQTNAAPFYAAVTEIDDENATTRISFENSDLSAIDIPESKGAILQNVQFDGFERDVLLINSVYKDPIFRKFYLFALTDEEWKPVVDGFILHVDNIDDATLPIAIDPSNPNKMVRSYSVFDMDPESDTKYTWILHQETVDILQR